MEVHVTKFTYVTEEIMEVVIKYVIRKEMMLNVLVMKDSNYQMIKLPAIKSIHVTRQATEAVITYVTRREMEYFAPVRKDIN
jgi:septum formation topological specificity factor MinE